MGKSPGKWIKSFFGGKKSLKSNFSTRNDILQSANKGERLVSSKAPTTVTTVEHSLISQLAPTGGAKDGVNSEHEVAAKLPDEEFAFSDAQGREDRNVGEVINLDSGEDPERIRIETAATKAQAAIRGFLARREFQTLKGIVKLQALIRGHLVRRQALATLCCVQGVVKFQALARGRKVRCSDVGIEVQNACNLGKIQDIKCSLSSGICSPTSEKKLVENAFARQLLASSNGAVPLRLQYSAGDSNSSWEWLERWTMSQFWESHLQQKKNVMHDSAQKVETKQGRPKRTVRKQSRGNAEHGSGRSDKELNKPKYNPKKRSHSVESVQEHTRNDSEKVSRNIRKTSDSMRVDRERSDVSIRKEKQTAGRSSNVAEVSEGTIAEVSEGAIAEVSEGTKDVAAAVAQMPGVGTSPEIPASGDQVGSLHDCNDLGLKPVGNNGNIGDTQSTDRQLIHKHHHTDDENQKISDRRSSFPPNSEHQENGLRSTPKLPSYMAPTESAKAKLRGQGSPRFSEDAIDSAAPATTRRHSLPSTINGKLTSMSPRAQKLIQAASKGVIRSDRSLSSSRDGPVTDKVVRAEWRR